MNDRVGVAPVDEALAPATDGQFTVRDGPGFEIDRRGDTQGTVVRRRVGHQHRLDQPDLRGVSAEGLAAGIGTDDDAPAGEGGGGRAALPAQGGGQGGKGERENGGGADQGPAAPAVSGRARSAATRKSRFIWAIVSRLMLLGQAAVHSP